MIGFPNAKDNPVKEAPASNRRHTIAPSLLLGSFGGKVTPGVQALLKYMSVSYRIEYLLSDTDANALNLQQFLPTDSAKSYPIRTIISSRQIKNSNERI
jgi:hypothetical protein